MDKISAENMMECSNLDQTEQQPNNSKLLFTELHSSIGEFERLREKENSTIVIEEDLNVEDSNQPAYNQNIPGIIFRLNADYRRLNER